MIWVGGPKPDQNSKRKSRLVNVAFIIASVTMLYVLKQFIGTFWAFICVVSIELVVLLVSLLVVYVKIYSIGYIWSKINWVVISLLVAGLPIVVAFQLHNFFGVPNQAVHEAVAFSFLGSYISFLGAFSLGYFIYRRGEESRAEERASRCRLLCSEISRLKTQLMNMDGDNCNLLELTYDPNWLNYYFEYEALIKKHDHALLDVLERYFSMIDKVRNALRANQYNTAKKHYNNYIHQEQYSIRQYTFWEADLLISSVAYGYRLKNSNQIFLCNQKEITKLVRKSVDDYFWIVENYIWNALLKSDDQPLNSSVLSVEIVDWLLKNKQFADHINHTASKRITAMIVFSISAELEKKSERVYLCWGEYMKKH